MKNKALKLITIMFTILMIGVLAIGCTKENESTKETSSTVESTKEVKVPILMYHHFDDTSSNGAVVKKEEFKKQIKYLKDNGFNTITLQQLVDYKDGKGTLPEKPVLITADDGYLSNYEFMYPILKENNMKATIFAIVENIDKAEENIKNGIGIPKFNWKQAKEMYDSGLITIQTHTYNSHHKADTIKGEKGEFSAPLKGESEEQYKARIEKDLKKSIESIEKHLGYKPIGFAYPYGEFSNTSEQVLKDNGIELSVTVRPGMVTDKNKDTYLLNRVTASGTDNLNTFIKKVNGEI